MTIYSWSDIFADPCRWRDCTSKRPSSNTVRKVASVAAVAGSCKEELSERKTAVCFFLAMIIVLGEDFRLARPARPIEVTTPARLP